MKINKKGVMQQAVRLAKTFEGDWQARMKLALKTVWAMIKKEEENMDVVNGFEIVERNYKVNGWQKYGHKRVYFEGYFIFNDHEVNAQKRVTFKGYFDAVKGKVVYQKAQARYEDFIKAVIKDEVNAVIASMNDSNNDEDEGERDFGLIYEGY